MDGCRARATKMPITNTLTQPNTAYAGREDKPDARLKALTVTSGCMESQPNMGEYDSDTAAPASPYASKYSARKPTHFITPGCSLFKNRIESRLKTHHKDTT